MNVDMQDLLISGGVGVAVGATHWLTHQNVAQPVEGSSKQEVMDAAGVKEAGIAAAGVAAIGCYAAIQLSKK